MAMQQTAAAWLFPAEIIHCILSFLSMQDKLKASDLSEEWLNAYVTYPDLNFNELSFQNEMLSLISHDDEHSVKSMFRSKVNKTLQRYKFGGVLLPYQMNITLDFVEEEDADSLNKWLRIAVECGVSELTVVLKNSSSSSEYIIPDWVLESRSLTSLSLENCSFSDKLKVPVLCKNILTLILWKVSINDDVLSSLIAGCRLIEHLMIDDCEGLNHVKLINLHRLKDLHIYAPPAEEIRRNYHNHRLSVEIDAPNLENVDLTGLNQVFVESSHVYRNLSSLRLNSTAITNEFFDNFQYKFPTLESLEIINCFGFERIHLTIYSLNSLELALLNQVTDLEIDTPNLTTFKLEQDSIPNLSFRSVPAEMKSSVYLSCDSVIDISWYQNLHKMLANLVPSTTSLHICFGSSLGLEENKFDLLFGVFWCCCPETMTLDLSENEKASSMVGCMANYLVMLKDRVHIREFGKCIYEKDERKWKEQSLDLMTLSDELKGFEGRMKVYFQLEWKLTSCLSIERLNLYL